MSNNNGASRQTQDSASQSRNPFNIDPELSILALIELYEKHETSDVPKQELDELKSDLFCEHEWLTEELWQEILQEAKTRWKSIERDRRFESCEQQITVSDMRNFDH